MPSPPRPLPVLPGVYLARVEGAWEGLPSTNLFAWKLATPPASGPADVAMAQSVANIIAGAWPTFATAVMPVPYVANEVSVYALNTPSAPAQVKVFSAPGGYIGALGPSTTSVLVKHTVNRRGRGTQGRTQLSPSSSNWYTTDGRQLTVSAHTLIQTEFDNFITNVKVDLQALTPGWDYVQLSKIPPGATYSVLSSLVEPLLSTQRRRNRRNG